MRDFFKCLIISGGVVVWGADIVQSGSEKGGGVCCGASGMHSVPAYHQGLVRGHGEQLLPRFQCGREAHVDPTELGLP